MPHCHLHRNSTHYTRCLKLHSCMDQALQLLLSTSWGFRSAYLTQSWCRTATRQYDANKYFLLPSTTGLNNPEKDELIPVAVVTMWTVSKHKLPTVGTLLHIEGSVHKGSISRNPNFSENLCFASFTS